jgi:hypothetical protein
VVTDDFPRFSWVYFLSSKDETPEVLIKLLKRYETISNYKVKFLRSDNGTEFKNRTLTSFCEDSGIIQQFSAAQTPEQNGVAEMKNRTLI